MLISGHLSLVPVFGYEAFSHLPSFNCKGDLQFMELLEGYSNTIRINPGVPAGRLHRLLNNVYVLKPQVAL